MALTYPLQMPTEYMQKTDFQLVDVVSVNRLRGGKALGTIMAPFYWAASMTTEKLTVRDHGRWDAFFDGLRGGTKSCLLYDTARIVPKSYTVNTTMSRAGGGAFDWTAPVTNFTDPRTVTMTTLPASFQLLCGDYVSFVKAGKYSLHRIVEDKAANGAGQMTELCFEPSISDTFLTGSTANFLRPKGEFILDGGSINRQREDLPVPVSFKATSRVV